MATTRTFGGNYAVGLAFFSTGVPAPGGQMVRWQVGRRRGVPRLAESTGPAGGDDLGSARCLSKVDGAEHGAEHALPGPDCLPALGGEVRSWLSHRRATPTSFCCRYMEDARARSERDRTLDSAVTRSAVSYGASRRI